MRSRFLILGISTVILPGLLIFFNASAPVRFVHDEIFHVAGYVLHPLNTIRLWKNGAGSADAYMDDLKENLAAANAARAELMQENDRLRSMLGFKEKNNIAPKGAGVSYYGSELGREYLLIDRGAGDGAHKGDIVIDAMGLFIGTVDDVEDSFSKVGVASNADVVFNAELLPSGVKAYAKGLGARAFSLELLPQNAVIRNGDYVMAKGGSASFPLGEVVRVETSGTGVFKEVRAVLLSHPELAEEVFVVSSNK